ncbi:hypothetical protein JTB14_018014 [Gonioctena quinquepunctata]|nr:hypothetical protein JTB14_018014 [Gonioctena quinquepunctata]
MSKSLAEGLVYERVGKIPIIICRLALVIPSHQDPIPGWFNNLQGPMGLFVASGKGVLRSMYMDSQSYAKFVPVDCAISGMLVFSWYHLTNSDAPYIFNVGIPECDAKFTWEEILDCGRKIINEKVPFNGILWYPDGSMTKSRVLANINFVLFQLLPAIFIDLLLTVLGYKAILFAIQMRIRKGGDMFEFYTNKAWNIDTKNVEYIRTKLNSVEKKKYILQSDKIDIEGYLTECILGARRHILKETDAMLPAARRNMKIMYALDRFCKLAFFAILGYYVYKFIYIF